MILSQSSFFERLIAFPWRKITIILQAIAICGAFTIRFRREIIVYSISRISFNISKKTRITRRNEYRKYIMDAANGINENNVYFFAFFTKSPHNYVANKKEDKIRKIV